jgi:uncharacterized protein YdaU (DUF1376 family)
MSTFSNLRPSKIDANLDFWFENKPSGNPGWAETRSCEEIQNQQRATARWLKTRSQSYDRELQRRRC